MVVLYPPQIARSSPDCGCPPFRSEATGEMCFRAWVRGEPGDVWGLTAKEEKIVLPSIEIYRLAGRDFFRRRWEQVVPAGCLATGRIMKPGRFCK